MNQFNISAFSIKAGTLTTMHSGSLNVFWHLADVAHRQDQVTNCMCVCTVNSFLNNQYYNKCCIFQH